MPAQVSSEERERLQQELTDVIWTLEQRKADPKPYDAVKQGVSQYVESVIKKSQTVEEFRSKLSEKVRTARAELEKGKPSVPAQPPSQTLPTSQPAPSSNTRAPPIQQQKAQARPPAEAAQPRQQPSAQAPPQQPSKPSISQTAARPLIPAPNRPSVAQSGRMRKLEDLRGPLEKCRAMLRVQAVFGLVKGDTQSKEVFMGVFNSTRETIGKSKTMSSDDMDKFVRAQLIKLEDLERTIRPRMEAHAQHFKLTSLEELFDMELEPMMLLDRYLHVHGNAGDGASLQKKLDTCVDAIGSTYKAKRLKSYFESKPY